MVVLTGNLSIVASLLLSAWIIFSFFSGKINGFFVRLPLALFILLTVSFSSLIYAYIVSDFSLLNVAQNSHTAKPLIYKITGSWGNHEGSMLLFVWLLSLFTYLFATRTKQLPFKAGIIRVQSGIIFLFLYYIMFSSNPFIELENPPRNGAGLNPLLQDIGLAIHPPLLYMGYCGFSLALSFSVIALLQKKMTKEWSAQLYPWVMGSWGFLTLGIGFGSWWAYRELGWGGFWFWDPVENSSLLPWLSGTALFHSLAATKKRNILRGWTIFLAILTFSLSITGFFLVRSGILTSVHSFTSDPTRGLMMLTLIFIVVGGSFLLYAVRINTIRKTCLLNLISRETTIVINNILLVSLCGTILLGVLYPIIQEVMFGSFVSIGAPYYSAVTTPIFMLAILVAVIAPHVRWGEDNFSRIKGLMIKPVVVAVSAVVLIYIISRQVELALISGLGVWLLASSFFYIYDKRGMVRKNTLKQFLSMEFGHMGIAVVAISISAFAYLSEEKDVIISINTPEEFAGFTINLRGEELIKGDNYIARRAIFDISKQKRELGMVQPEIRIYPIERTTTTESGILTSWLLSDLYIVIGDTESEQSTAARFYYRPMINGIWFGCILIALGGLLHIIPNRKENKTMSNNI